MDVEFNPDGSIKLPMINPRRNEEEDSEFKNEKVIRIIRSPIPDNQYLIDELNILISDKVENPELVEKAFNSATGKFRHMAQLTIKKIGERHFRVRIVSGQYRDSWIHKFRDFIGERMKAKIQYWGGAYDFRKGES